jgi:hypothetical protein
VSDVSSGMDIDGGTDGDREVRTILRWASWGSLIPVIGWVYGIGTLWTSRRFSRRDKIVGSLLFPGGWFGAFATVGVIVMHSDGYCWNATVGEVGSARFVTEAGCVAPDLPTVVGIPLTLAVLVAAALGPVYLRAAARR